MNSRLAFSSFLKNGIGILSRSACNLWITLGNMITLRVLILPICERGVAFHLFASPSVAFINVLFEFVVIK